MSDALIERYLKVKRLADDPTTTVGEREAARAVLNRMEQRRPSIAKEARAFQKKQTQKAERARNTYTPPTPSEPRATGNWEYIFRQAWGFAEVVQEVMEGMSDAQHGAEIAADGVRTTVTRRSGTLYLRFAFTYQVLRAARDLNGPQQEAFRQVLHEKLDEYLDKLLTPSEEER